MGRDLSYAFAMEDTERNLNYIDLDGFRNKVQSMNDIFSKEQLSTLIIERMTQDEWDEAFAFMTIMHEFQNKGYNYVYICSG